MLRLQCKIIIEHNAEGGKKIVSFDYVNAIEVKTSTKDFTDTATVKVPRKMYWKGHSIMEYLQRNDAITIQMGYSNMGTVATVFKGYISSVENSSPIVISCENVMRHFKTITVQPEVIKDFDIAEYVGKYAPDVNIVCPALVRLGTVPEGLSLVFTAYEDTNALFQQTMQAAVHFDIDPEWVKKKFGIEVTGLKTFGALKAPSRQHATVQELDRFFV